MKQWIVTSARRQGPWEVCGFGVGLAVHGRELWRDGARERGRWEWGAILSKLLTSVLRLIYVVTA